MRNLFIALIYSTFLQFVQCDLPSCIRAKCPHCKVPFIIQMCPMACSGCPFLLQNSGTSEISSRNSIPLENGIAQVRVPHAQRVPNIPESISSNDVSRNSKINLPETNEFVRVNFPMKQIQSQQSAYFISQPQQQFAVESQQNNAIQYGQYGIQEQNQREQLPYSKDFSQSFQQTTNLDGPHNQQTNVQQLKPNPVLQTYNNNNPFQPFLHYQIQSMYPVPSTIQQFQNQQSSFPGQIPTRITPEFSRYQSIGLNNNQVPQKINHAPSSTQLQRYQQKTYQIPTEQPILHAVPNVLNPLQRPVDYNSFMVSPQPQQIQEHKGKWIDEEQIFGKDTWKNNVKIPGNIASTLPGDNEEKCPKPNWQPCVPREVANQRFQNCCSRLGEGCSQLCSYEQNLTTIQLAVLTGRCPVNKISDLMICASGYEDATECCQAFGVLELGFEHCKPYCNPAGGLPNDGMLSEKFKCLQKLQQIQKCFYLIQRP